MNAVRGRSSGGALRRQKDLLYAALGQLWRSRRAVLLRVGVIVAVVVAVKLVALLLNHEGVLKAATPLPVVVLGAIIGLTYGLLAVGLVLIYRTNRVINFAHGQIGVFGAAFFGLAAVEWHVPYWIAFVLGLMVAASTGAVSELGVIRRLRKAPRLMSMVATLGIGQFLVLISGLILVSGASGSTYPQPPGLPVWHIGGLLVTQAYNGMLILSPLVVFGLALFLKRSRYGLAMRASAANPEAARMVGMFASRMSTLAWAIAGALAAFTAILTAPTQGFQSGDTFGPELLLRAMAAAVVGRMQSLPRAMAAGVGLGVLEQVLLWNYPNSGLVEVALFAVILCALLVQRNQAGRDEDKHNWSLVQTLRPVPHQLQELWLIRNLGRLCAAAFVALLVVLPVFISNAVAIDFTTILALSIVGLSVGILSGLGGQMSLGQFAIAAIGAVVSYKVFSATGDILIALVCGGLVAGVASVLVGLPALRIRGLMLSVTTLSFALVVPAWLIVQPWMLGDGVQARTPDVFGLVLDTGHRYYYFAVVVFVVVLMVTANVRRSGFGRLLVAIRDNEDNARAFAVRTRVAKVQGYFVAGVIAGIGGAVFAHSMSFLDAAAFPTSTSIQVMFMTVLGGIGVIAGPIVGALYLIGLPLINITGIGLAASQLGALLVIMQNPGGLLQFAEPVRDRILRSVGRRHGIDVDRLYAGQAADSAVGFHGRFAPSERGSPPAPTIEAGPLLVATGLRRSFGGVVAVADVSFQVGAGETVGLIGPNGAGKTTTFELLSGFTRPERGTVMFVGRDVTRLAPEARAQLGLIRSFQDAALFPTMTVKESVMVALERVGPTGVLGSTLGLHRRERQKEQRAREIMALTGLESYGDRRIQELSTGTRRISEIACLIALEPVALLLDEPSSGIAQRETESLGELLRSFRAQLNLTLVVIEHDIPLIMGIADRIICMADGFVIADGSPAAVRTDPVVVEAYLGGDPRTIERSGDALATPTG